MKRSQMLILPILVAGLLAGVISLSGCGPIVESTPRADTAQPLPTQPDVIIPTDLTPIVVSGTPVIIPAAIEFTRTPTGGRGTSGSTPTPLPTGFAPETFNQPTATSIPPLQDPAKRPTDPVINDFAVSPDSGLTMGEPVTIRWDVRADRASVSYEYTNGYGDVTYGGGVILDSLSGSMQLPLAVVDARPLHVTFTLNVLNLHHNPYTGNDEVIGEATDEVPLPMTCPNPWFFDNPPRWCSLFSAAPLEGVMQPFEKATLVAIENPGPTPHNAVYVLFEDYFWITYPVVAPGAAVSPTPGEDYAPDKVFADTLEKSLFYEQPVGFSTGGPTGPATPFEAHYQCEFIPNVLSASECYFNLPDGRIIRLSQDGNYGRVGIVWSEWTGPTTP